MCYLHNIDSFSLFGSVCIVLTFYSYRDLVNMDFIPNLILYLRIIIKIIKQLGVARFLFFFFHIRTGKHYWILADTATDCDFSLCLQSALGCALRD